jgi:subtilisin family serine protease
MKRIVAISTLSLVACFAVAQRQIVSLPDRHRRDYNALVVNGEAYLPRWVPIDKMKNANLKVEDITDERVDPSQGGSKWVFVRWKSPIPPPPEDFFRDVSKLAQDYVPNYVLTMQGDDVVTADNILRARGAMKPPLALHLADENPWSSHSQPSDFAEEGSVPYANPFLVTNASAQVALLDSGFDEKKIGRSWKSPFDFTFKVIYDGNEVPITCHKDDTGFDATVKSPILPNGNQDPNLFKVKPRLAHGTHCAGIIANYNDFDLVDCKVVYDDGTTDVETIRRAAKFIREANKAQDTGLSAANIRVAGLSWGAVTLDDSGLLREAMQWIQDKTLAVCSAGNGHESCDQFPRLPESLDLDYAGQQALTTILSVASVWGPNEPLPNQLANTSNYGPNTVQIAAEGQQVATVDLNRNGTVYFSGTSAAAAQVVGAAGQVASGNPAVKPQDLKWMLLQAAVKPETVSLAPFVLTGAILHLPTAAVKPGFQPYVMPGFAAIEAGQKKEDFVVYCEPYGNTNQANVTYSCTISREYPVSLAPIKVAVTLVNPSGPLADRQTLKVNCTTCTKDDDGLYKVTIAAAGGGAAPTTTLMISVYSTS